MVACSSFCEPRSISGMTIPRRLISVPQGRRDDTVDESIQRQYLWNVPDGKRPDFSETFIHGDNILISWNALNNSIYDLWLTSWNYDPSPVAVCLARAVNLAHDGNLNLVTPDPASPQLVNTTRYVLRFKPPTSQGQFIASDPDLTSPGFFIVTASVRQQGASSTVTSQAATASATKSGPKPSRAVATTPASPEPSSQGSPSGAAAGITIGLILAVGLLVALEVAYFTWWRRRGRNRGRGLGGGREKAAGRKHKPPGTGDRGPFLPLDQVEGVNSPFWMSPELPGDSDWGQARVHELPQGGLRTGTMRPGDGLSLGRPRATDTSLVELEAR
ncbi:hypothetical protein VTK56DRAFT_2222 [Thermocarpiscus australiensis]